ncbi:MAG: hypothetical protein HOP21_08785 [Methylotenera sp.]|nr:hypothetical protein [Methylotenera sp.]
MRLNAYIPRIPLRLHFIPLAHLFRASESKYLSLLPQENGAHGKMSPSFVNISIHIKTLTHEFT